MSFSRILSFRQLFLRDKRNLRNFRKCSQSVINLSDPSTLTYFKCVVLEHEHLYRKVQKTPEEYKRLFEIVPMVSVLDTLYGDQEMLEYLCKKHSGVGDVIVDKKTETKLKQKIKETEAMLLLAVTEPRLTHGGVLLEVSVETGEEENLFFAHKLFEMYMSYAESKDWEVKIASLEKSNIRSNILSTNENDGEEIYGIKKASLLIEGLGVPEMLILEQGFHQALIASKNGAIHTSFVSVLVLPQHSEMEASIPDHDLVVETYQVSQTGDQRGGMESGVRIIHIPTNTVVNCKEDQSQYENKEIAMLKLRTLLLHKFNGETEPMNSSKGNAKIRTYDWIQDTVTEHREGSGCIPNLKTFMEGGLALHNLHDNFIRYERVQAHQKDMDQFIKMNKMEADE